VDNYTKSSGPIDGVTVFNMLYNTSLVCYPNIIINDNLYRPYILKYLEEACRMNTELTIKHEPDAVN